MSTSPVRVVVADDHAIVLGGDDINHTDATFAAKIYPKEVSTASHLHAINGAADDWPESEDPTVAIH
jgi:hypothetical protein